MASHSSILVWRIPWTEEPGGLHSPQGCKESDMTEATQHACTRTRPCSKSFSVVVQLLNGVQLSRSHGLQSARLLCPWDFPDKNTGVACHFLLQGIFPTQGSNPCLLYCRRSPVLQAVSCTASEFFTTEPSGILKILIICTDLFNHYNLLMKQVILSAPSF